jgi:hypothetical protein
MYPFYMRRKHTQKRMEYPQIHGHANNKNFECIIISTLYLGVYSKLKNNFYRVQIFSMLKKNSISHNLCKACQSHIVMRYT